LNFKHETEILGMHGSIDIQAQQVATLRKSMINL